MLKSWHGQEKPKDTWLLMYYDTLDGIPEQKKGIR